MCKKLRVFQKFRNSIQEAVKGLGNPSLMNLHYRHTEIHASWWRGVFLNWGRAQILPLRPVTCFVWDRLGERGRRGAWLPVDRYQAPRGACKVTMKESAHTYLAHDFLPLLIYHCFYNCFRVQLMLFWSTRIATANSFYLWKSLSTFGQGLPVQFPLKIIQSAHAKTS